MIYSQLLFCFLESFESISIIFCFLVKSFKSHVEISSKLCNLDEKF